MANIAKDLNKPINYSMNKNEGKDEPGEGSSHTFPQFLEQGRTRVEGEAKALLRIKQNEEHGLWPKSLIGKHFRFSQLTCYHHQKALRWHASDTLLTCEKHVVERCHKYVIYHSILSIGTWRLY